MSEQQITIRGKYRLLDLRQFYLQDLRIQLTLQLCSQTLYRYIQADIPKQRMTRHIFVIPCDHYSS